MEKRCAKIAEDKTTDEIKEMIWKMETDPILSVVNSKKERMNSVFRVYSDLIYQIQIKMKKLENLKNQRIGFAKVLEQGLSLEE